MLPEVDMSTIKIKKQSYGNLSKDKKQARIKEDIVEYLTTISYIFANNSPKQFKTTDELTSISQGFVSETISAMSFGNYSKIRSLAESGDKMLKEIELVEVPEQMIDLHVKALKLAMYGSQMKNELSALSQDDPLKSIKSLSKTQGLLNVAISFVTDMESKIAEYKIDTIPLDL